MNCLRPLFVCFACLCFTANAASPNVVFILADDHVERSLSGANY